MEELPVDYTEHNLPLILLSGLGKGESRSLNTGQQRQDSGTRIVAESPECSNERAKAVLEQFLHFDGTQQPWNAVAQPGPTGTLKYRLRTINRSYTLPPRKAAPLPQSPTNELPSGKQISNELHSSLSPLSPGSPVFPDGVMTPLWFTRHQNQVPCLIIAFFDFTQNGGAAEDDKIKSDINAARTSLGRSGFRTRFTAVLISNKSIVQSSEMEERFSSIRRATSSDAKTGLFFMPPMPSSGEIASFVQGMLTTLQPICVEYYRELTKHARRKKTRYPVPASSALPIHGALQSLSAPGWSARYEIKQAVFAEFRQEMDVAERHYSQAIDHLCNADGVFEALPTWSPRWDETRLLCDSMALRIIRCHLWNGMTTTAVHMWYEYQSRMGRLIEQKGKGTHTYAWLAWESRWARIMAQLVKFVELPMLEGITQSKTEPPIDMNEFHSYSRPDKASQVLEAIPPIFLLHHPGYWNRLALRTARARHSIALEIPKEDRVPPGQSPASSVANRAQSYDTYLVPEPHEEFSKAQEGMVDHVHLASITEQAGLNFSNKSQFRMMERLSLDLARDLMADELYDRALEVLVPLWDASSWRGELWHDLFKQLLAMLNRCSIAVRNAEIALATAWEQLAVSNEADHDNLQQTMAELDLADAKVALEFQNQDRLSPLEVRFAFDEANAYAGDPVKCQLSIRSNAMSGTQSLNVSEIKLSISGQEVILIRSSGEAARHIHDVILDDQIGTAPLSLSPEQMLVLNFTTTFQEAGLVNLRHISIKVEGEQIQVLHTIDETSMLHSSFIYAIQNDLVTSQETRHEASTQISILPKPPKVDIRLIHLRKQHFIGETLRLQFELVNQEVHTVSGTISQAVVREDDEAVQSQLSTPSHTTLDGKVDTLESGATFAAALLVDSVQSAAELTITITFTYTLDDETQSALTKVFQTAIQPVPLLEPKWVFGPLLHPQPWPSYFDSSNQDSSGNPSGIPQRWKASFTARPSVSDRIVIHKVTLALSREPLDMLCSIEPDAQHKAELATKDSTLLRGFVLTTTKISADDRKPFQLEPVSNVEWSYEDDKTIHTSSLPVPRLTMPSSEPRVLCTVDQPKTSTAGAILQYHLENLSTHFLTFAVTMEASEDFAFSGTKYRTLSLTPLSRLSIPYSIMLHGSGVRGGRWIWPHLQVVDSYYQKTLRIQPGGPDVKLDAKNGLGVLVKDITNK